MGGFLGHSPCPKCLSEDNLSVYEDGVWCMTPGCGFASRDVDLYEQYITKKSKRKKANKMPFQPPQLRPIEKEWRGIKPETFSRFGIGLDEHNNIVFPYYLDGVMVGAKYRKPTEKEFWFQGESSGVQLFGMQAANGDRRIIVTEGELDALAATQMTGYPAVSVPFGADSAEKHVKLALRWLEAFDEVVVCLDADRPGQEAQARLMSVLKPGKGKAMVLPAGFKDANEMLKAGKVQEFKTAYYSAQSVLPNGVISKADAIDRAVNFLRDKKQRTGKPTGYAGLDELIGGWREAEVHTFVAGTGIGKSTVTRNLCYRQAKRGVKSLYIPLEDLFEVAIARFAEMDMHTVLVKSEVPPEEHDIRESLDGLLDYVDVFDPSGALSVDELVTSIEYMVRASDIKFIVLDHITAMANSVQGADERKALDICIEALKLRVAKPLRCTVVVVSHISRSSSDTEDNEPTLARIKGASSIAQYSDTVFAVVRDRDSHNTTIKTLKANRVWGVYGGFDVVWNSETQQLEEVRNTFNDETEGHNLEANFFADTDENEKEDVHAQQPTDTTDEEERTATVQEPVRAERLELQQLGGTGDGVRNTDAELRREAHVHARPDTTDRVSGGTEGTVHSGRQEENAGRTRTTSRRGVRPQLPA